MFWIKCSDGVGVVNGRSAIEQRMESVVSGSLDFGCINVRSVNSYYTIGHLYVCRLNWKTGGGPCKVNPG